MFLPLRASPAQAARLESLARVLAEARGEEVARTAEDAAACDLLAWSWVRARRGGAPAGEEARRAYDDALAVNLPLRSVLEEAAGALFRAGIPTIVYKGQDYLERVHDDLGARPMADVDLLVPRSEFHRAVAVLGDAGFRAAPPLRRVPHERALVRGDRAVDLHFALLAPGRMSVPHDALFARSLPFPGIEGARRFETTDALVAHAVAQAVKGYGLPASSYVELQALYGAADAARALERAVKWRAVRAFYCSLSVLGRLGNAPAAGTAAAVPLIRPERALLEATVVRHALAQAGGPPAPRSRLLIAKALLIDRWRDAAIFVPRWVMGRPPET